MTEIDARQQARSAPWTCPFCPLLCDTFGVEWGSHLATLALIGSDCPRARDGLARFGGVPAAGRGAAPRCQGNEASLDTAVDAAARILTASRQPLFGGLGTDVAGARALYPLAVATGAITDPAHGATLMKGLRALQDRGGFTTTLAEIAQRADLIVCLGNVPSVNYPEFFQRCGAGPSSIGERCVIVAGVAVGAAARAALPVAAGLRLECVETDGTLFEIGARLAALVAGTGAPRGTPDELVALAARLRAASYAVIVYDTATLPPHGELVIEAVDRIVATLNRTTRAASLPLGGSDGGSTVNQVFTWLSGLPLRSRAGPRGLEHEPLAFDAARLLAAGDVDALLWIASFGTEPLPPVAAVPRVVLGHPAFADRLAAAAESVFIPVATPGIGAAGHLFRTDSSVLMPLAPVYDDGLPTVADVVVRLTRAVRALRAGAPPAASPEGTP